MKPLFPAGRSRPLVSVLSFLALAGMASVLPAFAASDCSQPLPHKEQYLKDQGIDPKKPCPAYDRDFDSQGHACSKAAIRLGEAWDDYVKAHEKTCAASRGLEAMGKQDNCSSGQAACEEQIKSLNDKARQAATDELSTIETVQKRVEELRKKSLELANKTATVVEKNRTEFESNGPDKRDTAAGEIKAKNNMAASEKLGWQDPAVAKDIVKKLENGESSISTPNLKSPQLNDTARVAATANRMQQDLSERQSHLSSIISGTTRSSAISGSRETSLGQQPESSSRSGTSFGDLASMAGMAGAGSGLGGGGGGTQSAANNGGGISGLSPYQYDPNYYSNNGGGVSGLSGASSAKDYKTAPTSLGGLNSQSIAGNASKSSLPGTSKAGVGPGPTTVAGAAPSGAGVIGGAGASSDPGLDPEARGASGKGSAFSAARGGAMGGGFGGMGGSSKSASDKEKEEAGAAGGASSTYATGGGRSLASGGGLGEIGMGGMDSTLGTGDFSLSSSETDAAVKNMVADFSQSLEGEANGGGGVQPSGADILSGDSKTLFRRTKDAHLRALKRGNLIDHGKIRI